MIGVIVILFGSAGKAQVMPGTPPVKAGLDRSIFAGPVWAYVSNPVFREQSAHEMIKLNDSQSGWGLKGGILLPVGMFPNTAIELGFTYVSARFNDFTAQTEDVYGPGDLHFSNPKFSLLMADFGLHYLISNNPKLSVFGIFHMGQRSADSPENPRETDYLYMGTDHEADKEFTAGFGIGLRYYPLKTISLNAEIRMAGTFEGTTTYENGRKTDEEDNSLYTWLWMLNASYHLPF
jgi:hypothetical protein